MDLSNVIDVPRNVVEGELRCEENELQLACSSDVKYSLYCCWADDCYPVGDAFGRDFVDTSRRIELLVPPLPTYVWSE